MRKIFLFIFLCFASSLFAGEGKRPYEMDWANRITDEVPPLTDFEDGARWNVETVASEASFEPSKEQKLWGNFTQKLTYRYVPDEKKSAPRVTLRLEKPIRLAGNPNVPADFNAISVWVYGNRWGWNPDPKTPGVQISALFKVGGKEQEIFFKTVDWEEWFLLFVRLDESILAKLRQPDAEFVGFTIKSGRNEENRVLYFDGFAVRKDSLEVNSLTFSERPRRAFANPVQNQGVNVKEGETLPFPTRPETILPGNSTNSTVWTVSESEESGATSEIQTVGKDGTFRYAPGKTDHAPWDSLTIQWKDGSPFHPLKNGGVSRLTLASGEVVPVARHEFVSMKRTDEGRKLVTEWKALAENGVAVNVRYTLEVKGKSLILETLSTDETRVAEVSYGSLSASEVQGAKLIPVPYLTYAYGGHNRPEIVAFREAKNDQRLFLSGHTDWYSGNGSEIYAHPRIVDGAVFFNDGVRYNAKTDGTRNACFERFFVTVSPEFADVLPTIPNPPSPWISLMGRKQWHARGAGNREADKKYWFRVWRNGMREMVVVDHEVGWRDGGESFTFRTKTAPKKGGNEGQRDFSDYMNQTLDFFYGPYNNFTDFAPVNEYWSTDFISRTTNKNFQSAWNRCYAPKPVRAVEYCEKLTPINQNQFHFRVGYCDVHTAISPCDRVDYDARVPGAGTYAATFYAFGEVFLLQKKGWNGPTWSEGPMHHFYAGLNDGSYAQDQGYRIPFNPWLVDYDLLKMHPLGCNVGMGNLVMFYASRQAMTGKTPAETDELLDRFYAATLAFGHSGYLPIQHGVRLAWRGYFGTLALQSRYTQVQPEWIRYVNAAGELEPTSEAVADETFRRSQVCVKYADGTVICANGSETEPLETTIDGRKVALPPTGYTGWTADGKVYTFSGLQNGKRADYAVSPDYVFLDGRGTFQQFPRACGAGAAVCRKADAEHWELIPLQNAEMGFAPEGVFFAPEAVALDFDGNEIGKTSVSRIRRFFFVAPVKNAFSYRLTVCNEKSAPAQVLSSPKFYVYAGEVVKVQGPSGMRDFTIPTDAKPGVNLWFEADGSRINFQVLPLCVCEIVAEDARSVTLRLTPTVVGLEAQAPLKVRLSGTEYAVDARGLCVIPLENDVEKPGDYKLEITAGERVQSVTFRSEVTMEEALQPFNPTDCSHWMQFREKAPQSDFGKSGAVVMHGPNSVGGVLKNGFFTHPPYQGGVGRVFIEYELDLTQTQIPLTLRAFVGWKDGVSVGDGLTYRIAMVEPGETTGSDGMAEKETVLAEVAVGTHDWTPIQADLGKYAGKRVKIRLISDPGPQNNTQGDWGAWGEIELISTEKQPVRRTNLNN